MAKKKSKRISVKTGMAPGSLIHVGNKELEQASLQIIQYNTEEVVQTKYTSGLDQIKYNPASTDKINWLHFSGIDIPAFENLGTQFNIHNLVLEDILNPLLRPKFEDFTDYCFLSLKLIVSKTEEFSIKSIPVNLILINNYVISFMDSNEPIFEPLLQRLQKGVRRIGAKGVDYLLFALADLVIDNYFYFIEKGNDHLEFLEETIEQNPSQQIPKQIQESKKTLLRARRNILPLKEAYHLIINEDLNHINEENLKYFRDTQDHILFGIDQLDFLRENLNNLQDTYQSSLDNQLNKTMKLLTLISTIFIPLSFLAGVYGMNFKYMPELEWKYAYFSLLIVMFIIATLMILWFKKKNWL